MKKGKVNQMARPKTNRIKERDEMVLGIIRKHPGLSVREITVKFLGEMGYDTTRSEIDTWYPLISPSTIRLEEQGRIRTERDSGYKPGGNPPKRCWVV